MVYPQPPAAALQLADPNWYPYQQMMLYQVSPQGYVPTPTHYLSGPGGSPIIPGPVYHPFPGKAQIVCSLLFCSCGFVQI